MPKGMVAFIQYSLPSNQPPCPSGWEEAQYATGRLILATTDGSKVKITQGEALADRGAPTHSHPFSGTANIGHKSTATVGGKDKGVGRAGDYATSGTTATADSAYPFIQYLICEYFGEPSGDAFPYGTVSFFNLGGCPTGWSAEDPSGASAAPASGRLASGPPASTYDGRFFLATPAGGRPGTVTSVAWSDYQDPGHVHSYTGSVDVPRKRFVAGGGANKDLASHGGQPVSGGASVAAEPIVPFVTLLACRKEAMGTNTGLPNDLVAFMSAEECPDGWGDAVGAPGRFLIGMAGTGTQGFPLGGSAMNPNEVERSHSHTVDGAVNIPHHDTDLTTGWPHDLDLGRKGEYSYTTESTAEPVTLPYVMLTACAFNSGS